MLIRLYFQILMAWLFNNITYIIKHLNSSCKIENFLNF